MNSNIENLIEQNKIYNRRYRCHNCGEYNLHIDSYDIADCEEGCSFQGIEFITSVLRSNDYNGHFTKKDIEENFLDVNELVKKHYKDLYDGFIKKDSVYTKRELKDIENLTLEYINLQKSLDIFSEKYFMKFPHMRNASSLDDLGYIVNMLEDIGVFLKEASLELQLYDKAVVNLNKSNFYSGRFFLANCIWKVVASWERIINILAIIFDITYENDYKKNSFRSLYDKLKANNDFKITLVYRLIDFVMSRGIFNTSSISRMKNDHDMSLHIEQNLLYSKEFLNDPKNDLDKNLKDTAIKMVSNIYVLYYIIQETMKILDAKCLVNSDTITIKDTRFFNNQIDYEGMARTLNSKQRLEQNVQLEKLSNKVKSLIFRIDIKAEDFKLKHNNNNNFQNEPLWKAYKYYVDIIFRLHEIERNFNAIAYCINGTIKAKYQYAIPIFTEEYFTYSAFYRVYSCYDKLCRLLVDFYNLPGNGKQLYFEDIISLIQGTNIPFLIEIGNVHKSKDFKDYMTYRHMIFHSIRPGATDNMIEIHNIKMQYLLYENVNFIIDIVEKFFDELV